MKIKFEFKITALYLLLGGLWILFSDRLLNAMVDERAALMTFQTYKGWFYVLITGAYLFVFVKRHLRKLRKVENDLIVNNAELARLKERAEESDRLKTLFLQNVSHELRTPMNGIVGFSQILMQGSHDKEKLNRYLKLIVDSSNQLLRIISNIMDISKIESNVVDIHERNVPVNELLDSIYHLYIHQSEAKAINFELKYGKTDKEFSVFTDEQKLHQILSNLVNNAIKYTPRGKVELGYKLENDTLVFWVSDTGIGIPAAYTDSIFERFTLLPGNSADEGGTGLGLAICKGYLDRLGGRIWVDSELDRGSTFFVSLPFGPGTGKNTRDINVN